MKLLHNYVEGLRLGAALDQKSPAVGDFVMVPLYEVVRDGQRGLGASSWANTHTIFLNDALSGKFVIVGVSATFHVASTSATVQIEVCNGTTGIGSGTNQLTAPIALSGTVDTPQQGTMIAAPTTILPGGRINMIVAGTNTSLGGAELTVVLKRVS